MSKTIVNFILDSLLAATLLGILWTNAALQFIFPVPSRSTGWTLWGFNYDQWSWFSFLFLFAFVVLAVLHVMLHWSWVCGVVTHRLLGRKGKGGEWSESTQTLIGVGFLVLLLHLLGALFLIALLTVQPPEDVSLVRSMVPNTR